MFCFYHFFVSFCSGPLLFLFLICFCQLPKTEQQQQNTPVLTLNERCLPRKTTFVLLSPTYLLPSSGGSFSVQYVPRSSSSTSTMCCRRCPREQQGPGGKKKLAPFRSPHLVERFWMLLVNLRVVCFCYFCLC